MRPNKLDKLILNLETQPSEGLDRRIAAMISHAGKQGSAKVCPELALWRRIMQNKTTKIAAVIAIVLVSIVSFHIFDSTTSVTWADVIEPLMNAHTATFDITVHSQAKTSQGKLMAMGQRIRYEFEPSQNLPTTIIDYENMQMQYLIPERKEAVLIDLRDLAETEEVPENYLQSIRDVIKELENDPSTSIEQLPEREVDGRTALGFHAQDAEDEITVWADPETMLPIRLEQVYAGLHIVCTNFQFDIALDPSLFSMDIPAGYSTASGQLDFEDHGEQGLLEGFRIWAQILEDDQFPEDLTFASYRKMPGLKKKLKEGTIKLTQQEKVDLGIKMGPFFKFVMSVKPEQDWQYVGAGVPFGDADRPVCWYKPVGSDTYRVIYGDLSVKDLAAGDLPK
jgi:outer membrane lipoprotein-sorting protein